MQLRPHGLARHPTTITTVKVPQVRKLPMKFRFQVFNISYNEPIPIHRGIPFLELRKLEKVTTMAFRVCNPSLRSRRLRCRRRRHHRRRWMPTTGCCSLEAQRTGQPQNPAHL